jgi:hypothetical protein
MAAWLAAVLLAGCVYTTPQEPAAIASDAPTFTPIGAGVQAALDSPDPLFYVDGSYYLYRDGVWLTSKSATAGFHYVPHIPGQLLMIHRPAAYANLHLARRGP